VAVGGGRPRRRKSFNHKHLQRLKEIEAQKHIKPQKLVQVGIIGA